MRNESSIVVDETKKRLKSLKVRWNWPIANGFKLRVCRSYSIAVQYMAEKFHIVLEIGAFRTWHGAYVSEGSKELAVDDPRVRCVPC